MIETLDAGERAPALRERLLTGLNLLGCPAEVATAALASEACTGLRVDTRQVSSLRRNEVRSWERNPGARPAYLSPAIHFEDLRPLANTLTSSAWALETRIIGSLSARANYLRAAIRVSDHAETVMREGGKPSPALKQLLRRFGRGLVEQPTTADAIQRTAYAELTLSDEQDLADRQVAAARLLAEPVDVQLFGRVPV